MAAYNFDDVTVETLLRPKLRWVWVWLGLLSREDVSLGVRFVDTSMLVVLGFGCYD